MAIEVLGDRIRNNADIKGLMIDGVEEKGGQYADDLWLLIEAEDDCISAVLHELEFYRFAGLKINHHKTSMIRVGNWPDPSQKLNAARRLSWSMEPIKLKCWV